MTTKECVKRLWLDLLATDLCGSTYGLLVELSNNELGRDTTYKLRMLVDATDDKFYLSEEKRSLVTEILNK